MRAGMGSTFRKFCRWEVGVRLGCLLMTQGHLLPGIHCVYFQGQVLQFASQRFVSFDTDICVRPGVFLL